MPVYEINNHSLLTDRAGVSELLRFFHFAYKLSDIQIKLDLSKPIHVDANLSALILALLNKLFIERNVRVYVELGEKSDVFFRNGFISHLKGKGNVNEYEDDRKSTIALTTFNPDQSELFCGYLKNNFFNHRGLENLDKNLKKKLRLNYIEVFNNVELHAESKYKVFCCGQYFPERHVLKFTLIDLGEGFLKKINKYTGGKIKDDNSAIIWSTQDFNSTKSVEFGPGGTGLKELIKFCNSNNGSLHICSGLGYVQILNNKTLEYKLPQPFPGSLVNIIIRDI